MLPPASRHSFSLALEPADGWVWEADWGWKDGWVWEDASLACEGGRDDDWEVDWEHDCEGTPVVWELGQESPDIFKWSSRWKGFNLKLLDRLIKYLG